MEVASSSVRPPVVARRAARVVGGKTAAEARSRFRPLATLIKGIQCSLRNRTITALHKIKEKFWQIVTIL